MNNNTQEQVDFSTVIAVAIHDMKNSLSLLMQSIEQIANTLPASATEAMDNLTSVHYEASRMNTALVQVLGLYRSSIDALPIHVDEVFVSDLLEEIVESNATYTRQKKISIHCDIDSELAWFFDRELIYLLLHDVIINAMRYGCSTLHITAEIEDEQLVVQISDDGPGYPEVMLKSSQSELTAHSISEGRTGLGLFFARLIANAHKNKGRQGRIALSNGRQGGSIFTLYIP